MSRRACLSRRMALAAPLALVACQAAPGAVDGHDVARVERYLNTTRGLTARVVQTWPDGGVGEGTLSYDPGNLRLDYRTPHPMRLVATGGHLVFRDGLRQSVTRMNLSHQPLGLLLAAPVHLGGAVVVTAIRHDANVLQISMARSDNPSQGLLTLGFSDFAGQLSLVAIDLVDARRDNTRLRLTDVRTGADFPPGFFSLSAPL
ncbi:LolA family protein [Gluconacetobacter sacchari]|uniref:Outer membrane lipoprotein carrier protein LolA n=2 Tax=Gluconacetobacter sacchari TaxID=92759 RepID=A0A7W4NJV8_9PROT|nr:outer membrane lipoprotein carrier protein LolA [Gluconacetobacter sacchari]MBB2159087.1 outer membrane lipoprotein carrier protein LolA [Gluconacetobacter sacchari]GBQ31692.1 outer-membrane lipoprotein carrier protein [Gluconacetobacter sacchari DSM 12717]